MDLLLVEDKDSFRRLLVKALEGGAWKVEAVGDPAEALALLEQRPFHVLVTDLRLPGQSGIELIRRAKRLRPALRAVLMSAFGEPRDIVEAMKLGTDDFLPKPFDLDDFLALLERLRALAGAPPPPASEPWIAASPALRALDGALRRAADTELPVLFTGPRGSGKARAARRLHVLRRPHAPYLAQPASEGLDPATLRLLQGGSLYLPNLEALDARAAEALAKAMDSEAGRGLCWMGGALEGAPLPEPLRHRLAVLELRLPALAERREDLLPLLRVFLERAAGAAGRPAPWLDRAAEKQVLAHAFPGGARELEALAGRLLLLNEGPVLRRLPDLGLGEKAPLLLPWPAAGSLEAQERALLASALGPLLRRALAEAGGDLARAAEALGITARSLGQRLREQGIPLDDEG